MVFSPRPVAIGVASLAALLMFPGTAAPAGPLPDPPVSLPALPGNPTVGVTPGGDGATADVGAGDMSLQVGVGTGGLTIKPGSRGSGSPAGPANDSFPVGIPALRPGDNRAQTSTGPSGIVFGPANRGKAGTVAGARTATGSARRPGSTSRPAPSSSRAAAPSESNRTKPSLFFDLVDRIPGFVRAGIAALALVALAIWAAWVRTRRRLAHNAFVDPVTGIANGRAFEGLLAGELERAKRYKRPLALLVVEVRDARHSVLPLLDQTLRAVTGAIQEERLREADIIARLGPSRFGIICPEATTTAGETLARALEARLEELRVHVSIGTAQRQPTDLGPAEIMRRAEPAPAADGPGSDPGADNARRRALLKVA
jgi:diguanylate cyclase (GGDEF)-like protein